MSFRDDDRMNKFPVGSNGAQNNGVTGTSDTHTLSVAVNGFLKGLRYKAPALATDTTYTVTITEQTTGQTVYTEAGIADNGYAFTSLTWDAVVPLRGSYFITWSWTTSQIVAAADFETILYYM